MRYNTKAFAESTIGAAVDILEAAGREGRGLTAEESIKVDTLKATYAQATGRQVPASNRMLAEWSRQPVRNGIDSVSLMGSNLSSGFGRAPQPRANATPSTVFVDDKGEVFPCVGKEQSFADAVREKAEAQGLSDRDQRFQELVDDGLTVGGYLRAHLTGPRNSVERAALQGDDSTGGGYMIPQFLSAQVIDMFRARNQVVSAGAQSFQMNAETHSFARVTSQPTCGWVQEIQTVPEATMTFGKIVFTAKNLRCVLKSSRNLLEDAPNINSLIEKQLAASFAAEVDRVALYGLGAAGEPSGLTSDTAINEVAVGGPLTGHDEILDGYELLLDDNAPDPTALIMSNREWLFFAKLKDGDGLPAQRPPAIANLPFLPTSKATTGEMLLGYFPDLYLGMLSSIRVELLRELYAETHQFGFLCHLRMDCGTVRSESFCKLTGIT